MLTVSAGALVACEVQSLLPNFACRVMGSAAVIVSSAPTPNSATSPLQYYKLWMFEEWRLSYHAFVVVAFGVVAVVVVV